jgi:hypothetical protein
MEGSGLGISCCMGKKVGRGNMYNRAPDLPLYPSTTSDQLDLRRLVMLIYLEPNQPATVP